MSTSRNRGCSYRLGMFELQQRMTKIAGQAAHSYRLGMFELQPVTVVLNGNISRCYRLGMFELQLSLLKMMRV